MDISRRTVIGAGAALPLTAASSAFAAPTVTGPSPGDWADLDRTLAGSASLPGSYRYESRVPLFDPRWDYRRPAALARILSRQDISTCITFARDHGLTITGRSGGHSYIGASRAAGSLVIDTRSYTKVHFPTDRAETTVQAGANLYSVHAQISRYGRSIPTGTCPTVGSAGLTLVGGLGVDSRRYGLTIDRLVSATVIDGRGVIRKVDANRDPDLFWALRGGGSGAAMVADLTYRTIPATSMGFFNVSFPASSTATVLRQWAVWMADQPRDTWANAHVDTAGSSISVRVFGVTPVGLEATRAASLRRAVGITPLSTSTTTRTHLAGIRYLGGGSTTPRTRFAAGSDILRTMTSDGAEAVVAAMRSAASRGLSASAILDPLDGAMATPAMAATAFPWRNHVASIQWYVGVGSSSGYAPAQDWIAHAHDLLSAHSRGGYFGYVESGRPMDAYFAGNYPQLAAARLRYDPDSILL
ncbi:hypothetical protein ASG73_11825 [Janibacter sp. Soil728]|uniref:FAD-binding oxidoreductase n=1 Tax=Janibacter sp. Soil728 TaxID=1736393 RepID=UPI0006F6B9C1|nr:FAD-dependent oxidoreductase [Janibacter sp. Soil728]KRE36996.1 hypothetical protein ASG73_11825 [Janibacter sp. Soil728]